MLVHKKTIPALGLLLLTGALAFPHLSQAVQLGLDTNINVQAEHRKDKDHEEPDHTKEDQFRAELQFNTEKSDNDRPDNRGRDNADWQDKNENDSRFGIFGSMWNSLTHWGKDKDKTDDKDRDRNDNNGSVLVVNQLDITTDTDSAAFDWHTNHDASATLEYSTSANLSNSTSITFDNEDDRHSIDIDNLEANTTYYYRLTVDSNDDRDEVVKTGSFKTEAAVDQSDEDGPTLLWIRTSMVSDDSATIAWITPSRSTTKIWIESDSSVDTSATPKYEESSLGFFHNARVEDLEPDTTYYFKVASIDKDGNVTISTVQSFTTKVE